MQDNENVVYTQLHSYELTGSAMSETLPFQKAAWYLEIYKYEIGIL